MIPVLIVFFVGLAALITLGFCSALGKKAPSITAEQFHAAMNDLVPNLIRLDPAEDGWEVLVIRTEMMSEYGAALYWRDPATRKVLPRPMGLYEIMDRRG